MFEQSSLPLSVTFSFGTPNLAIKYFSIDSSIVAESLDTLSVVVRKPESQSLIVSVLISP